MVRVRLLAAAILAAGLTLAAGIPARAVVPPVPDPAKERVVALWPAQMPAAGISGQSLDHHEVLETGKAAAEQMMRILRKALAVA